MSQPVRNIFEKFLLSYTITHPRCRHGYEVRRNMRGINLDGVNFPGLVSGIL